MFLNPLLLLKDVKPFSVPFEFFSSYFNWISDSLRNRFAAPGAPSEVAKAEAVRTGSVVLCETNPIFSKTLALGS